jgi:thioester reductase-like protein
VNRICKFWRTPFLAFRTIIVGRHTIAMSRLLLTGATGMVGREILARAIHDPRFDSIVCLIRPPLDRLDTLLASLGIARSSRVAALAGDITEPALGISDSSALADVTHVIHCAATVTFDHPLEEARAVNVFGARSVLDLCRRLPKLERLDAVSTCYVAGKRDDLVREADLLHSCGFHNTYEQTKYEAEQLLRERMRELPIAVHRPSIVVGDSRTGRTGSWKMLYWPLKVLARGWLPAVPYDPEGRLDIVPVDFVANAILTLSSDPTTVGKTFHVAAGPDRDTTLAELANHLSSRLARRAPLRVHPIWWRRVVRPALMLVPSKSLRRTLKSGLVYRPYLEMRLRFDTSEADARLAAAAISCPRVLDYIDTIVDAAIASDFGRRDAQPA